MAGTGVYRESVERHRKQALRAVSDTRHAHNLLRDKTTTYAREIAELLALHARVEAVWRAAPDDIDDGGR